MGKSKELKYSTPRFYEMDGALRAYANRSIVVTGVMGVVALFAVAGFLFVRMEPPTVIRVASDGQASVVTASRVAKPHFLPSVLSASKNNAAPDSLEKDAFVKNFLVRYLNYNAHTLSENWAEAMNQMTVNLRKTALSQMEKNDTVGKLEDEQASSVFKLSHVEEDKNEPLTYRAYGVRTVHTVNNQRETIEQIVEEYHVRLLNVERSADNPSGLLVGEYWSKQIEGEQRNAVLLDSALNGNSGNSDASVATVTTDGGGQQ
jgi:hypothetical protein